MSMAKTDITVRTEECQEGILCEVYHLYINDSKYCGDQTKAEFKFVEESLEGALSRTLEDPLYPGRRSLRRSQPPVERNRLKDTVVHRPRINKGSCSSKSSRFGMF
ncbi:hypothetical protein FNV43_RR21790 [Rhamnella rubrinervis]|uniref:Uncharacterized protein n=1 Tax=Rhamnella rubrinervis TaxID=2594499 RepID=A0A8K0DP86_9ROSA|nr:hypothetical protein FNV43_RR21790 [Rhamnella rubrinervis]